ncbi:MAG: hypothetical protein ABI672_20160, partial [Vicinamibacteria bacterium]
MSPARSIRLSTVTALAILVSAGASAASPHPPSEVRNAQEIQKVVADLCDAKLVFLGEEGSHGGAVALQVKAEIIEDLVTKCHFNHVAFESQLYDFEDLKQRYRSGTATEAALSNAVGGLWSTTTEIQPLLRLLHKKAVAGDVILSGIDGQIGGATGIYTQKQL